MALVELIATPTTEPEVLDQLEAFVTTGLGKSVVRAKDTPNFIANRVGIAGMLATMKEAENFGLSYDVVDDLTGKKLGRASSGTFRTADVVGLDTMAHVIKTLQDNLQPDRPVLRRATPRRRCCRSCSRPARWARRPAPASTRRSARTSCASTRPSGDYVAGGGKADEIVDRMLKKPAGRAPEAAARIEATRRRSSCGRSCATASTTPPCTWPTIADSARDVDFAMRWGFGIKQGPFELWQEAGWKQVAAVGQGRHRRRQGAEQGAAAGLGVRRPAARRRAHAPKARGARRSRHVSCRVEHAAGLPAPALPRERASAPARSTPRSAGTTVFENDDDAPLDAGRRGADRQHQDQDARSSARA